MKDKDWTEVQVMPNGEMYVFNKLGSESAKEISLVEEKITQTRRVLSDETQDVLARRLIKEFKSKNAMTLGYLDSQMQLIPDES